MHRRRPGHGGDLRKGVSVRAATAVALEAMALTQVVRPGDLVVWSQSSAEPLSRSRESIGGLRAKWLACRRRQRCELFALDRPRSKPVETGSCKVLCSSRPLTDLSECPDGRSTLGGALQRRRARRRQCAFQPTPRVDVDQTFVSRLPIGSIEPKRSLGYSIGGSAAQRLQQFGISRSPGRALVETRAGPATADELAFDPPFLRVEARPFG